MMNEARPFASLSGSLLARKGGAKPAMRPRPLSNESMLDDLGWDDMGHAFEGPAEHVPSSIAALTPAPRSAAAKEEAPLVHAQQRALADHFESDEQVESEPVPVTRVTPLRRPAEKTPDRRVAAVGKKAAFTLRLDADRHLRLRLANALTGQSSQQLVTAALDAFLESLPEVSSLARQIPTRAGAGN
jgi:hypothetical protein